MGSELSQAKDSRFEVPVAPVLQAGKAVPSPSVKSKPAGSDREAIPHGTPSGYNYWRCRCDDCRRWLRDSRRASRARLHPEQPTVGQALRELALSRRSANYWKKEAEDARDLSLLWKMRYLALKSGRVAA